MSETRTLASFAVNTSLDDIPRDVRDEAKRAILNFVGCALGGCREPAMDIEKSAMRRRLSPASARVGRNGRASLSPRTYSVISAARRLRPAKRLFFFETS